MGLTQSTGVYMYLYWLGGKKGFWQWSDAGFKIRGRDEGGGEEGCDSVCVGGVETVSECERCGR